MLRSSCLVLALSMLTSCGKSRDDDHEDDEVVAGAGGSVGSGGSASGGAGTGGEAEEIDRGPWTYFKASNSGTADFFGTAVAASADGTTLVVGANGESGAGDGTEADPADNSAINAGAVYVFVNTSGVWQEQAYLKAPNSDAGDGFGHAIAVSADGNTLAVAAPYEASAAQGVDGDQADNAASDAGAVYVFSRSGNTWTPQAYLKAEHGDDSDFFGIALALSADGNLLAVGAEGDDGGDVGVDADPTDKTAPESGAVYVYTRSGAAWTHSAYLKASNTDILDHFGGSVALSSAGTTLAVGAYWESSATADDPADNSADFAGAVYVFGHDGSSWTQSHYIKPSAAEFGAGDDFGSSVSLSERGDALAVGAPGDNEYAGSAYLFSLNATQFYQDGRAVASNAAAAAEFGNALALAPGGHRLAVGAALQPDSDQDQAAPETGAVYVFDFDADLGLQQTFSTQAPNADAGDRFGRSMTWADSGL
ncbi:MAG TPA: hypothetical protein VN764_05880, partial [Polyangiaceae bacterium]|nr:hypothetical protein [Polyangiaceae bacterium]